MNYCQSCGSPVSVRVPPNEDRARPVCDACGAIHYVNPKIIAGCIPEYGDKILFCRRAIEPRRGLWTLPAGFMEMGETTVEAAVRETWEEARAQVAVDSLFSLYSIPHISQVYVLFRAKLLNDDYRPGPESLEVTLFQEEEIPWQELAFPVIRRVMEDYFADRRSGAFQTHVGEILERMRKG